MLLIGGYIMGIKIELPKNPMKPETIIQKNKKLFSDDLDKEGYLAKSYAFIKMNEPTYNEELKKKLMEYYQIEIDISVAKRVTKRLSELGLLNSITSGELMIMPRNELEESPIYKEAYRKFFVYLDKIPKQFRRNYDKMAFYWIPNGVGEEYLEWCCKLLNFKMSK